MGFSVPGPRLRRTVLTYAALAGCPSLEKIEEGQSIVLFRGEHLQPSTNPDRLNLGPGNSALVEIMGPITSQRHQNRRHPRNTASIFRATKSSLVLARRGVGILYFLAFLFLCVQQSSSLGAGGIDVTRLCREALRTEAGL